MLYKLIGQMTPLGFQSHGQNKGNYIRQTATAEAAAAFDTNRINNHTTSLACRRHAPTVNMLGILYIISESGELVSRIARVQMYN